MRRDVVAHALCADHATCQHFNLKCGVPEPTRERLSVAKQPIGMIYRPAHDVQTLSIPTLREPPLWFENVLLETTPMGQCTLLHPPPKPLGQHHLGLGHGNVTGSRGDQTSPPSKRVKPWW